jgi:microsomal dipeptidase-like Zn-dependent dipeptidase
MKRFLLLGMVLPAIGLIGVWTLGPGVVERQYSTLSGVPPYPVSARAAALHATLSLADLHADSLLWGRDLSRRGSRGHVDIPRLIEGGYALQVFSLSAKVPRGLNYERNADDSDVVTWLALVQRWPVAAWTSRLARALYESRRLNEFAANSADRFTVIRSGQQLRDYLQQRQQHPGITAGLLSLEGSSPLEGKVSNLEVLYAAGFRMIGLSHFVDTDMGGSAAGADKYGLTPMGRELVLAMQARHVIVDLAHSSAKTIDDVLAVSTRPVVVSHTGVKATCDNNRNLSDAQVRKIAAGGGLIGIGFWDTATCGHDARAIARAIRAAIGLAGIEHVALGSDFDGAVEAPFDSAGSSQLTAALLDAGLTEEQIRRVMGENALAFLVSQLP